MLGRAGLDAEIGGWTTRQDGDVVQLGIRVGGIRDEISGASVQRARAGH